MTAKIALTQGLFALVDEADVGRLIRYKWSAHRTSHCQATLYYARAWVGNGRSMMHNLLTGWATVDHINGNGLDNRRANLRASTHNQNMGNRRKICSSSSQFKGVYWQKSVQRWRAQIGHNGKRIYLGLFDAEDAAAHAYDAAARELFGEFAALNFPGVGERSAFLRGASL